ncbi:MAG: chorismate-binding protein [Pseudomonadales bacterium]
MPPSTAMETGVAVRAQIHDAEAGQWLRFAQPAAVLTAATPAEAPGVVDTVERLVREDGLYGVGFLSYEAAQGFDLRLVTHPPGRLPAAWFALFRAPVPCGPPSPAAPPPADWIATVDADAYGQALDRIRAYIAAGDTYQVNFSYRLRASLQDDTAAWAEALFGAMVARQPGGYGARIDTEAWSICSASHELFFSRRGRAITSRPMKGTAPRGATAAEDALRARWLAGSMKNRAENLMITDMVRNDLGRIADVGSVQATDLFRLEPYPTLWQLTSTVRGDSDAPLRALLGALFPAASITGAPKRRTMEIIRELEATPREIYTGSVALLRPDGSAQLNVAIRTALVDHQRAVAEYGVGGGILWDSTAAEEYEETRTKARILAPDACPEPPLALLETLLWQPGEGYWLLPGHLDRLAAGAAFFGMPDPRDAARDALERAAADLPARPHRVRLVVPADAAPEVTATPLDGEPPSRRVCLSAPMPLQNDPYVLHKTTRRAIYQRALTAARQRTPEADDVLLVNQHGEVTESTIANLMIDLDGELLTPPLASGLLAGVYRRQLLESGEVSERPVTPDMVHRARAVYLLNSVRGRWPVTLLETGPG